MSENEATSSTDNHRRPARADLELPPRPDHADVGEENETIINLITDCFDNVKDHDFAGATACAAAILGNTDGLQST